MAWQDGLSGSARNVAAYEGSPLRVLAGPGTGKTFALIRRAARLLEQGAAPDRILVVTFTRTAARDLAAQLQSLQIAGPKQVRAGTLHSLCFSILSSHEVFQVTGRVPRPMLGFEVDCLLMDLPNSHFGGLRDRRRRLQAFEAAWARLQHEQPGWPLDRIDQAFKRGVEDWLRFHEAMLVGEVVPETLRYLRNNPTCPERTLFQHVLVDEYQDLNRAEQVLIDLLSANGALAVIGDDDQSIYGFKFAHPEGIVAFHEDHPGTHDETLIQCRRCPRLVVNLANSLIKQNDRRPEPPRSLLSAPKAPSGTVYIVQWKDLQAEAEGVAQFVRHHIEAHAVKPGKVLVLAPRRIIGHKIAEALVARNTLARCLFNESALDLEEAKERFELLNLLVHPLDRVALRWLLGFGSPNLRSPAYCRLLALCHDKAIRPWVALEGLSEGRISIPYASPLVSRFDQIKEAMHTLQERFSPDDPPSEEFIEAWLPSGADPLEPLRALATEVLPEAEDIRGLFEGIQNRATRPELPEEGDMVRVMSLHKSKGLTADLVVVAGCVDGLIPTLDASLVGDENERQLEEQRRLFFVAITRTTNRLLLSSARYIDTSQAHRMRARGRSFGVVVESIASRFLDELGPSAPPAVPGDNMLEEMFSD